MDGLNSVRFQLDLNTEVVNVYLGNSLESIAISLDHFKHFSIILLDKIKTTKGRSFSVKEIEEFILLINLYRISSSSKRKTDIEAIIIDPYNREPRKLGFSIKSWLGSLPTLLNPSRATHFIFEIQSPNPLTQSVINGANTITNFHQKFLYFKQHGIKLLFRNINSQIFNDNLILIDSQLPEILAFLLEDYYSSKGVSKVSNLVARLTERNPLGFTNKYFYEKKIRDFLCKIALGMMPNSTWNGYNSVDGGHILVCRNGDLLTYFYIYYPQDFENYLFKTTKFETASKSRYEFGQIYLDNNSRTYNINLNLQVRFLGLA